MAAEPAQIAQLRLALGQRLAAFRQVAGITQGQLARVAFCDRTTVVHIEKGRRPTDERFWMLADEAVGAAGALLADFRAFRAARDGYEQRRRAEALAAARARAAAPAVTRSLPDAGADHDGELVDVAAEESSRFVAWAEEENVGELTLEQLHAEVRRISHAYLKVPTAPLFARTRELRDRAVALLAGRQRPRHARDLYAAAGWSLTMLAWMSVDLGRPDAGEDHARAAWLCAERAEHDGLRAWVRATQHTAAYWQHDFTRAATYAVDGMRYATGSAALFLASAHALDLARAGQGERARQALHRAQQVAEASETAVDELAGPFTCSLDRASGGFWSEAQLALGAAEPALDHADRAIAASEATPRQRRNLGSERMVRLLKVRAHLALGQFDGAEATLAPVLETPPGLRARPLLLRMRDIATAAAAGPRRADPIAARLCRAAVTFHRDTAPELPA